MDEFRFLILFCPIIPKTNNAYSLHNNRMEMETSFDIGSEIQHIISVTSITIFYSD